MRLLVVEDESLLAEQIREHLVQQQFSVDVAHDGADGWFDRRRDWCRCAYH